MSLSRTSSPQQSRHRTHPSMSGHVQPPNARMSPASRYHSNLKVLRRRDPSIISIFDQFSHVCVYHHNGTKWEKQGFEGSMFLYERESYPPYGFYILNRVGMDDYIQRLYPEDDIKTHGGYVMLRSYPNFTASRLDAIHNNITTPVTDKFSDIYAYDPDGRTPAEKGESQTIGLWTFTTDGREPLHDVMLRLHSYIKKNQPYPEEYRYGPDRPPPPNPHLRPAAASGTRNGESEHSDAQGTQFSTPANGLSELDKLFAKFLPQTQTAQPLASSTAPQVPPTSQASASTSSMSVQSLFAALGGTELSQSTPAQPQSTLPTQPRAPSTGISLLDTIFASASASAGVNQPTPAQPQSCLQPPVQQNPIPIHSPTPQTTALPPPQVLSQNVIGSLLGLPPSRAPSAASSTASYGVSSPSHPSSRDGDNEDESHGSSSDGSGRARGQAYAQALGRSVPIQIHAPLHADPAFKSLGVPANGAGPSINGDATPRPAFTDHLQNFNKNAGTSASAANTPAKNANASTNTNGKPRNGRPLVPFEPNSELWPYPRQPLDEGLHSSGAGEGEEGDIIELDFEDMSALSDPDAFLRAQQQQQAQGGRGKKNGTTAAVKDLSQPGGKEPAGSTPGTGGGGKEKKKKDRKKNKKERLEAIAREREAIEKSWDFPDVGGASAAVAGNSNTMNLNGRNVPIPVTFHDDSPPASPSPVPSPEPRLEPELEAEIVQVGQSGIAPLGSESGSSVNGIAGAGKGKSRRKGKKSANATATATATASTSGTGADASGVQPDRALQSLLTSLAAQPEVKRPSAHERNVFVRELLTLIQTDPEFADTLWRNYYAQSA